MWSSCSDGNMLRLSLEQRWILLIMTRSSSLFAAQWLLPMSSHESQCFPSWRDISQFSTSDPAFPFLSTTPVWERGDVNFSSLFRLLTHYPECMWVFFAEPSAIMLILADCSSDLSLHLVFWPFLMLIGFSESFQPVSRRSSTSFQEHLSCCWVIIVLWNCFLSLW